jgi:AcrR family transcriptional regulator
VAAPAETSLRERKKAQTRDRIVREALRLFADNGYQQTTIAQIAEVAEVSPRTVSTYFPAKEDIVFDVSAGAKERLAATISERPEGEGTMGALRRWLLEERKLVEQEQDLHARQQAIIESEESLMAHQHALMHEFERVLAQGLATDLGVEPTDLKPRMAAAAAMAVFDLLRDEGDAKVEGGSLPSVEEQLEVLDQAFAFITGGVAALRERSG